MMGIDRQDLLYSFRSARHAPFLSLVAIVALSLGIGLNAGVFTLLDAMFLEPPTQKDPASFVQLYPRYEGWFTGAGQFSSFTTEDYEAIRTHSHSLKDAAAWQPTSAILEQGPRRIASVLVTCNYFHAFGIDRPRLGRFFARGECEPGTTAKVAVLSEPFWKSQFHSDPQMVGKTIHLNSVPLVVIGIIPSDAANLLAGGVFVPCTLQPLLDRRYNEWANPDSPWLSVAGRLRPGSSKADAQAELATILRQQDRAYVERKFSPFNRKTSVVLTSGSFVQNPAFHDLVIAMMSLILGPLSLVLLLACSNVTMLFLSRAIVRRGEIAVRLALGIGRARLARMLLIESLLTASAAGILSIALAYRVPLLVMNIADPNQSGFVPLIHPNWRVFAYLLALVTIAALTSSLAPMHAAWKLDLLSALKRQQGAATMRSRTTSGLIIAQIAMSFVLLTAAVLFARFPGMVTGMDPGFDTRHVVAVPLELDTSPQNHDTALNFERSLQARILAIPGIQSLAYATLEPFRQLPPVEIRLADQPKGQGRPVSIDDVSTAFFPTFGIRLLDGRSFVSSDPASVTVVSQAFAHQFWPGGEPVGKIILTSDDKRLTVIGVVADTRSERFGITDGPRLYTLRDPNALDGALYVRFTGNPRTAENAVREIVKSLDPTQIGTPQTIWESLESEAEQMRSLARIILVMASIALLLAITGVYAVLSFAVSQRALEFGIRMVMGANRKAIFQSIVLRGLRQIAIGLVFGLVLAEPALWSLTRLLRHSPLPLHIFDTSVYAIAAVLLVVVSLAAMCLPAFRATQVDPIKALRTE